VLIEPHCAEAAGGDWVEDIADLLSASALGLEHNPLPADLKPSEQRKARAARAAHAFLNGTSLIEDVAGAAPFTDEELGSLSVPLLAVYGEYTDLASSARKLEACVPGCRLDVLPGLGHSVLRDARDLVLGLVEEWLATFPGPGFQPGFQPGFVGVAG
jgi:pimeloyl-ACP methyl ester carboxylesterase